MCCQHAPPGETLPDPGNEPMSLRSPALEVGFFTTSVTWEALLLFLVLPFKWIEVVKHFFGTLCSESLYFKMRASLGLCGQGHHCNCSVLLPESYDMYIADIQYVITALIKLSNFHHDSHQQPLICIELLVFTWHFAPYIIDFIS